MLAKRMFLMFFSTKNYVTGALWNIGITLVLFVAFLGTQTANTMNFWLGFEVDAGHIVIATVFGGLVGVICVNICIGVAHIIVEDFSHAAKDFHVSPISRKKIGTGYLIGILGLGAFITGAASIMCVIGIVLSGGNIPTLIEFGKIILTVFLATACASTFTYLIVLIAKTPSVFNAYSGAMSTLIGFMMGVYVPIVALPEPIQWVIRIFPLTHAAAMFRQIFAGSSLEQIFANAPEGALQNFNITFGLLFDFGVFISDFWISAGYLAISSVVFFIAIIFVSRKKTTHF